MIARDRHFGNSRRTSLRSRIGVAVAVLVGGGAIAAGAVVATSHGAPTKVQTAGYASRVANEWTALNTAMNSWTWSKQTSYNQLAGLTSAKTFSQTMTHGKMLAVQRGIVVLATKKFIILRSANGALHLWLVSGGTKFQNVSTTKSGMTALTASTSAANQAMTSGNKLARGDLALIAGTRSHWTLHAQLVLFAPLRTADVGGKAFTSNQGGSFSGTHS